MIQLAGITNQLFKNVRSTSCTDLIQTSLSKHVSKLVCDRYGIIGFPQKGCLGNKKRTFEKLSLK